MGLQKSLMWFGIYSIFLQNILVIGVDDDTCKDVHKQCSQVIGIEPIMCTKGFYKGNCQKTCGLCKENTSSGSVNIYAAITKGYENYITVTDSRVTSTLCPCSCEYKTKLDYWGGITPDDREKLVKEILQRLDYMTEALKVNKTKLSSFWRRHQSTKDHRKSAKSIGLSGAVIIIVIFAIIISLDFFPRHSSKVGVNEKLI